MKGTGGACVQFKGWGVDDKPCEGWYGVRCEDSGRFVVELNLAGNGLAGTIPAEISKGSLGYIGKLKYCIQ